MTLQAGSFELQAAGNKGGDTSNLYVFGDHLGSAVLVQDARQKEVMRLGYSPFGQVYRKQNDTKFWKLNSGVNANNQLNQLMPYQYTGRYTEGATGYTHLDARWYNPYTQRFNQPDYWSFNNTGLPKAVQHELMRFTGLNTAQLLADPAQQMRYGYVAGNALSWVDLMGLCEPKDIDYVNPNAIELINIIAEVEKSGYLSSFSADQIRKYNLDPELTVSVSADKLVVVQNSAFIENSNTGHIQATGYVTGIPEYLVHGQVSIRDREDGSIGIYDQEYDFEYHEVNSFKDILRNIETAIGRVVVSDGTDFWIHYEGDANVFKQSDLYFMFENLTEGDANVVKQ